MNTLGIDIETYSAQSLKTGGVYKYVADPSFEILIFYYSINDGPVQGVDLTDGRGLPAEVTHMLTDAVYVKTAWNAMFERTCLAKHTGKPMDPAQWECTMVRASMLSLPMSLDQAGSALQLNLQKDKVGGAHLKYFCIPCKPTKANGGRTRNLPHHDPVKWEEFKLYCKRDVEAEQEIRKKLSWFEIPEHEQRLWELDQEINDRGVLTDWLFINRAMKIDESFRAKAIKEAMYITGLRNPNSVSQLLTWLSAEMPLEDVEKLRKEDIPVLIEASNGYANERNIQRVLEIRQELSKTSVKKYQAMVNVRGADGRARGLFQYYGANRTGRWAGRLVQMQNLPKTTMHNLEGARKIALQGDDELLDLLSFRDEDKGDYMTVPSVLSQLIRTAFIPKPGTKFVVVDSSAIEARILSWLAGEEWRMEIFRTHGKIYEASASRMFGIPFDQVTKDDRAKGKVSELALGYQGGANAMIRMDVKKKIRALAIKKWENNEMLRVDYRIKLDAQSIEKKKPILSDEELLEEFIFSEYQAIVDVWRPANPAIKTLWQDLNDAAIEVVCGGGLRRVGFVQLRMKRGALFIDLPSGRSLVYLRPVIRRKIIHPKKGDPFEVEGVAYMGVNQEKKTWGYEHTYGGKLTENICQAIARDCLGYWMLTAAEDGGLDLVGTVHDELIVEDPEQNAEIHLKWLIEMMSEEIPWAPGLPLAAAGFVSDYYKKD